MPSQLHVVGRMAAVSELVRWTVPAWSVTTLSLASCAEAVVLKAEPTVALGTLR